MKKGIDPSKELTSDAFNDTDIVFTSDPSELKSASFHIIAVPTPVDDAHVPDLIVTRDTGIDPEREAELADSVGLALLVVLEVLAPAERLAFVLHDTFAVPFDEISRILDRSPDAVRQLASRARRRVQGAPAAPDGDRGRQREVVDAFFAAARAGDFDALVSVLDPDVVLRADAGAGAPGSTVVRGAAAVAGQALMFARPQAITTAVLVNGAAGVVVTVNGQPISVMGFTVARSKVVEIDVLVDPERLRALDLSFAGE